MRVSILGKMCDKMTIQRVAVLGLGIMGTGMARNLIKAGFAVTVYNRSAARAEPFAALGAQVAQTSFEAAQNADLVFSMVGDDNASRAIWLGEQGALAGVAPNTILVECSTLSITWVRELAALAAAQGVHFIDSPVMGSKQAAEDGALRLTVGGSLEAVERARPALEAISREILHMGEVGNGALMKLINNMVAAIEAVAISEALALAEHSGMDVPKVVEALSSGAISSPFIKARLPRMVSRDYQDVHFALTWMRKDVSYALQLGEQLGVMLPVAAITREMHQLAMNLGYADMDAASVMEAYRRPKNGDA